MGTVSKLNPHTKGGRPPTKVGSPISVERIAAMAEMVDEADVQIQRGTLRIPAWLAELIKISCPKASQQAVILHALQEVGFPVNEDQLRELRETGTFSKEVDQ